MALTWTAAGLAAALVLTQTSPFAPEVQALWPIPLDTRSAPACAACHLAQTEAHAHSRHGLARSPGLLGQLPTAGPHVGEGAACLGCHAPELASFRVLPLPGRPLGPGQSPMQALSRSLAGPTLPNPAFEPAASGGVTCAACHWRGGAVLATKPATEAAARAHPVRVEPLLGESAFCAACHQFEAEPSAHGKPLEDTFHEWQTGFWGKVGPCQGCHLVGGDHAMEGIHAPTWVGASLALELGLLPDGTGTVTLLNDVGGHDFPSYTTPRAVLRAQPEDGRGRPVGAPVERVLGREVRFAQGKWTEVFDTRVAPRATATLRFDFRKRPHVEAVHAQLCIEPDAAYVAIYTALLETAPPGARREQLTQALAEAKGSPYCPWEETQRLPPR